jgi:hypothetical protein
MSLRALAVFSNLSEAEVAGSALRAHGVWAETFDHYMAVTLWDQRQALGGIRLMVREADLHEARSLLNDLMAAASDEAQDHDELHPPSASAWRWAAGALCLMHPLAWMAVAGPRIRNWSDRWVAILVLAPAAIAAFIAARLVARFLVRLSGGD